MYFAMLLFDLTSCFMLSPAEEQIVWLAAVSQ